ncbi:MAG: hypothetical protein ACTSQ8_13420 [Candidatus Helarchaeota archaeon]
MRKPHKKIEGDQTGPVKRKASQTYHPKAQRRTKKVQEGPEAGGGGIREAVKTLSQN